MYTRVCTRRPCNVAMCVKCACVCVRVGLWNGTVKEEGGFNSVRGISINLQNEDLFKFIIRITMNVFFFCIEYFYT